MNTGDYPIRRQEHDSEAVLLGQAILHPERYAQIMQGLPPEAFDHPHHRIIATLAERRHRSGEAWDVIMLMNELGRQCVREDKVDEEMKRVFITFSEITMPVATTMSALAEHLQWVRGAQEKRALAHLLDQSLKDVLSEDLGTPEIMARVENFRLAYPGGSTFSAKLEACVFSDASLRELEVPVQGAALPTRETTP